MFWKTLNGRRMVIIGAILATMMVTGVLEAQTGPFYFYPITPCRAVDTRLGYGGIVSFKTTRTFTMKGVCGVPTDAKAVSLNVTVTEISMVSGEGWVALYPSGTAWPGNSVVNFIYTDVSVANGAIVPLGSMTGDELTMTNTSRKGTYHLVLDVTGYYK